MASSSTDRPDAQVVSPEDLSGVIAESKERLAAEEAPKVKRPRGRPRKADTPPGGGQPHASGPGATQGTLHSQTTIPSVPLAPLITTMLHIPFNALANRTGFDGYRAKDDELKPIAQQIEILVNQASSETDPVKRAVYMTAAALLSLVLGKSLEYQMWMRERAAKEATPTTEAAAPGSGRPADTAPTPGSPTPSSPFPTTWQ